MLSVVFLADFEDGGSGTAPTDLRTPLTLTRR